MELYSFYQSSFLIVSIILSRFSLHPTAPLISAVAIGLLAWLVFFILQGFGLYAMAKKRGLKKKALAFIPFANIWYMGKLAGECHFFSQKMKRAGMYAMVAQIVTTLLTILTIAAELYLWIQHGEPARDNVYGILYWPGLTGFSATVSRFYDISGYLLSIFQLVTEIFMLVLVMGLYKKYTPKNYMILSFVSLFVPASRYIIIFVLRNRQEVDYEAYMRARREAYIRRQQQYYNQYGNPYNQNPYNRNSYGNPYGNPYGQNQQNGQNQTSAPKQEEPFAEFSSSNKGENSNGNSDGEQSKNDSNGDGFFN